MTMTFRARGLTNIRAQPNLQSDILGQIAANQSIEAVGDPVQADNWMWYEIANSDGAMWIAERSVDGSRILLDLISDETSSAASNLDTTLVGTRSTQPTTYIARGLTNIRDEPSLQGQVVGQIAAGQAIQIVGVPVQAGNWIWREIADADGVMWIAERSVDGSRILLDEEEDPEDRWAGVTMTLDPNRLAENTKPDLPPNIDIDPTDYERTYRASLAITRAFEGGSFASYNNYDRGIVSYGIMQFTLSSGSLGRVLGLYLMNSHSRVAEALHNDYMNRVRDRDPNLRHDDRFRELLTQAADEATMQDAQFQIARTDYWDVVMENYVQRRGNLRYPLTYALFFDMGIHFGVNHPYVRLAEEALGVPSNSRVGENGITEEQLTQQVAELRRDSHYRQAERENLPGLRVRGDFWVNIADDGDWFLQGDADGLVYPKSGRAVQVRTPT